MPRLLIRPPDFPAIDGPLVFLAGPIQGAPDWQDEAGRLLGVLAPALHVASPRRSYLPGAFDYTAQVDWETHHLRRAAACGAILFWLAREAVPTPGRAYAQTTRFELAEWKVRQERDGVRLVVGIEAGFTGERYVRRRFAQDCPGAPLCESLEETCRRAADFAGA
ncbi:hypothetical protein [Gemmata sp.]|uniref:hypothetical protein n=1 Tax=Gemmata sp. TaxID=1914242 RepID=UPI003F716582